MSQRCVACGEELSSGARFCSACGTAVAQVVVAPAVAANVPPELQAKFESVRADLQGDRRQVVVLFADLEGFTGLAERLDPEEVTLLVGTVLQDLATAVYEYEGYVDKFMGDAIMALFGAPLAHEDDPDRAVLAGLGMVERVARRNEAGDFPLALRVGIHAGEVVAAHLGDGLRLQYTVVGDAVNVAARLEHAAQPNTVLVSDTVHARVAPRFNVEALEPIAVKGRVEPVAIYRVVGWREGTGQARTGTPFVGRGVELLAVEKVLAQGGIAVLEGEAGAGKSRLAREAIDRAAGTSRVLELGFSSVRRPGQRSAPAEVFRQLAGSVEQATVLVGERHRRGLEDLGREAGLDAPAGDEAADPAAARDRRRRALAALIRAAARAQPLVLLVEDLHWADEETRDLLAFLLQALAVARIAAILTARPEERLGWLPAGTLRLALGPLDESAAGELVGRVMEVVPPDQRRELLRRAAGNPLFLEELSRVLRHGGSAGAVPDTVQGLLRARIDRLDPSARSALQMASVLGGRFPVVLLERMYGLDPQPVAFSEALGSLEAGGFVVAEDGERRFTHDLLQEVAYGGLLMRIRKVLHESAARLGEELYADRLDQEAAFFAHHYWEAGLRAESLPHLWTAGRSAAERYDLPAAERQLRRAAEAMTENPEAFPQGREKARFCETLGKVLLWRGDLDGAELWFGQLERDGETGKLPGLRARALELRGRVAWHRGRLDEAQGLFEAGLAIVPPGEQGLAADLHNAIGIVHYYRGRPSKAFGHHEEALRLREELEDLLGMAKSHSNIGNLLFRFHTDLDGAEERYRRALELAEKVGDRQQILTVVHNLGGVALQRGSWMDALNWYGHAERLHEDVGWSHLQWLTCLQQARCEVGLGRIGDAVARLEGCRREGDAVLEPVNRVNIRLYLFDAWLCARADDRAASALAEAQRLVSELGVSEDIDQVHLREGRLEIARGDWAAAARAFAKAEEAARRTEDREVEQLAAAHRLRAEARGGLEQRGGWAGSLDTDPVATDPGEAPTYNRALIAYLLADAEAARAPSEAVAERLAAVADRAARMGSPALEQAALASLAKVHLARGDEPAAREALDRTARATLLLADGLPAELRSAFLTHPRSAL